MIISFPRTGTAFTYKVLKEHYNLYGLYEPFNKDYPEFALRGNCLTHDVIGEINHDYYKLPKELLERIYENAKTWMHEWVWNLYPDIEVGGSYLRILREIDRLDGNWLIKDVYIWIHLKEICERFKHCKVIALKRPVEEVYNSYMGWWDKTDKYAMGKQITNAFMISVFFRKIFDYFPYNELTKETFKDMLKKVYAEYIEVIDNCLQYDNFILIEFKGKLSEKDILDKVKW